MPHSNTEKIRNMFDVISEKYDLMNNLISLGTHKFVKNSAVKRLDIKPNMYVLDLCTGTGDIARSIRKIEPSAHIIGADFSHSMIEKAVKKSKNIRFIIADATDIPFADNEFDIVTVSFGLRNIPDMDRAVEEIYRVLKPGGQFMQLDFNKKNFINKIFDKIVTFSANLFFRNKVPYEYLIESKKSFPLSEELIVKFSSKGFKFKEQSDFMGGVISSQIMVKPE